MLQHPNGRLHLSYILKSPQDYGEWNSFQRDVEAVGEAGYEGMEVQMRSPEDFQGRGLDALLKDYGLRLAGIQTGSAYSDSGVCLATPDAAVRARAEDLLKRYIEFAARFSAPVVFGLLQGSLKDEPDPACALSRIREHLAKLAEFAEGAGTVLVMEPVNRYECAVFHNTTADVVTSITSVGSPALRAMVDTFHVNIEEPAQRDAIHTAGPLLAHVHLSETNRGLLGSGHLNFREVFAALREVEYNGFVSVGVYREEPALAERAQRAIGHLQTDWNAVHA